METYITFAAVDIFLTASILFGMYYLATAIFSLITVNFPIPEHRNYKFAVAIPAHNEEKVISRLIKSIRTCDYPQDCIEIFIAADECSDRTALFGEKCGAHVLSRNTSTCKGDALGDLFEFIENSDFDYEYVAVFDADNIVGKHFFSEMSDKLSMGHRAVQGYVDSSNSNISWVANAHSVWYWITNCTMQTGRDRLSLGCRLDGTGFALERSLLKEIPWKTITMAEDREYTCMLAESDIKIAYCETAVVYDEKPVTFSDSVGQRIRWSKGASDVQGKYGLRLLGKLKFNAFMGLWYEVFSFLSYNITLFSILFGIGTIWQTAVGKSTGYFYLIANIIVIMAALIKDKKTDKKIMLNLFGFILYMVSWLPIGFFALFGKNRGWYHTGHGDRV